MDFRALLFSLSWIIYEVRVGLKSMEWYKQPGKYVCMHNRTLGWTNEDIMEASSTPTLREFGINFLDLDALLKAEGLRDPGLRKEILNLHRQIRGAVASPIGKYAFSKQDCFISISPGFSSIFS
jgi:hypothetical protein